MWIRWSVVLGVVRGVGRVLRIWDGDGWGLLEGGEGGCGEGVG